MINLAWPNIKNHETFHCSEEHDAGIQDAAHQDVCNCTRVFKSGGLVNSVLTKAYFDHHIYYDVKIISSSRVSATNTQITF